MNNENTHNHLRSFFLPKNREIMKTHEVSNVSPTRCRVTLRPMYGTRSTRSKKESLDGAFSLSLSLSFLSLSLSVSSVTQFVVSSRFYESNKLYLAARHGRWVMGVVGGDSLFLSLSRRKSTQDHGRTFSTNNTNPWQSRQWKYLTIWIKGTRVICLFSSGLIASECGAKKRWNGRATVLIRIAASNVPREN